jgi:hypothetical protein
MQLVIPDLKVGQEPNGCQMCHDTLFSTFAQVRARIIQDDKTLEVIAAELEGHEPREQMRRRTFASASLWNIRFSCCRR